MRKLIIAWAVLLMAMVAMATYVDVNGSKNIMVDEWGLWTAQTPYKPLRFDFVSGTNPAAINLHPTYATPGRKGAAIYDSGDGVWRTFTSTNIPVVGSYVQFAGNWRKTTGTYNNMFKGTLNSDGYTCNLSGTLRYVPTNSTSAYDSTFHANRAIVSMSDNPLPNITLPAGVNMYYSTYNLMFKLTNLPSGFMDTRGITGTLKDSIFQLTCSGLSNVTVIPPNAFDLSNMSGEPEIESFSSTCANMLRVTNAYIFNFSSNITFNSTNVSRLSAGWYTMGAWPGQVMWGTNVLVEAIPTPSADNYAFRSCSNMPNWATINANWK